MLQITVPARKLWDDVNEVFMHTKEQTLQLEHSLVSLSKWESKWCKPFYYSQNKTHEELLDYIKCMTITQNVKPEVYYSLTQENIDQIEKYIKAPMTATVVTNQKKGRINNEIITAELIYYWMFALTIPMECQKWHLNRLITLINLCNSKNQKQTNKPKPMSSNEVINRFASLNAERRKQLNSKG